MSTAAIQGEKDEQMEAWSNAVCPFCQQTATWDSSRRTVVSDCRHLRARTKDGAFIFHAD